MRITLLTMGSRGDVEPFVALGRGLHDAGHEVELATGTNFEGLVAANGLYYRPIGVDIEAWGEEFRREFHRHRNPLQKVRVYVRQWGEYGQTILDDSWAAVQKADAIIYNTVILGGRHMAERCALPAFLATSVPHLMRTSEFPNPLLSRRNLGDFFNRLSYLTPRFVDFFHRRINRWRREALGLPLERRFSSELELQGQPIPILYHFSPHVVPPPRDWTHPHSVTGCWRLPPALDWQPSTQLLDFLASGPPPVYVGFGSTVGPNPQRLTQVVVQALRDSGQRGLLCLGWGGVEAVGANESNLSVRSIPHDWLFPQVAAVVHHGGMGTTTAAMRAGRPMVICPFLGDQPFWGQVAARLGVAPEPIPVRRLTATKLSQAIRNAVTDPSMRTRAAEQAPEIQAEDGVKTAVEFINNWLQCKGRPKALATSARGRPYPLPGRS